MYYALPAEGPLQLIANPGRTRCLFHSNGRRDEELYLPRFNLGGESFRANSRFRSTRACKTAGRPAGRFFFSATRARIRRTTARGNKRLK